VCVSQSGGGKTISQTKSAFTEGILRRTHRTLVDDSRWMDLEDSAVFEVVLDPEADGVDMTPAIQLVLR
jgi:hypothetical protein